MIHKHRYFWTTLSIGMLAGALVNVLSYWLRSDGPNVIDGYEQWGWPFIVWREGGFSYVRMFSWMGLASNAVIWLSIATVLSIWVGKRWREPEIENRM